MNTMNKKFSTFLVLSLMIACLSSCKKDEDVEPSASGSELELQLVNDIPADTSSSGVTYYSLSENKIIDLADSSTMKWDIAFWQTKVYTNNGTSGPGKGGALVVDDIFEEVSTAPESGYLTDSGNDVGTKGWYSYTGSGLSPKHAILPVAGKVLIIKTADGKYAKVEIFSYYQGNPNTGTPEFADLATRPAPRFYTFKYIYQPDGTRGF